MRHYIGLIHKERRSDYGISFPDFPGCISAGSSLEEVAAMGAEALAGHMRLMEDEGLEIPRPSSLDAIMEDKHHRTGIPVLVPAPAPKAVKTERINISMPTDVLSEIDRYARIRGLSRSSFLVRAARKAMDAA
jgi:predicted RNase H-like HicB family nuclease